MAVAITTNLDVVRVQFQSRGGVSDSKAMCLYFDLGLPETKTRLSVEMI